MFVFLWGLIRMVERIKQWLEKIRPILQYFNNPRLIKGTRITYGVVWNLFLLFLVIGLISLGFASGAGAGYFASLVKDEPIRSKESMKIDIYNYEETSELYFANDIYLGKLRSDLDREEVELENISEHLKNAVIATEDEYFNEHNGVVPKSIIRAILQEVLNSDIKTGGSTLTQQLIKNQILTNEVSFERKAKEILLALRLETFFEKDQILEAYLNVSTFGRNSSGRNIAGVQTAAKGIFGVNAKDLNLPQAAYIAGLPQSPSRYTPFTSSGEIKENLEPGITRMKTVLNRMLTNGYINDTEYQNALKYDITKDFIEPKKSSIERYPWLTIEIESQATKILAFKLAKEDGYEEDDLNENEELYDNYLVLANRDLRQNGYKIYSTIDKEIYDKMQEIVKNFQYYGSDKPEKKKDLDTGEIVQVMEPVETGSMLIDNKTGRIISFVGGRDHNREQINHATQALRQNGSTMKPLLVYGPGLELGKIQPGSIIADVEFTPKGMGKAWPHNFDNSEHGLTSVRNALQWSYNIPAVKTYMQTIDQRPITYLEKMGITSLTDGDAHHLSMALGGLTRGVTVEENTNAFATLANYGKFVDAYLIEKIETKDGVLIYEHESKPVEVFSPQTSYLTLDMLRDVVQKGTGASLQGYLNFSSDWAGKTGTSQDYNDIWFVATNPNVTMGIWMGYDTPKSIQNNYKGLSYTRRNILLWSELMNAAYDVRPEFVDPDETFKMPGGIVRRSYCTLSGLLPSDLCQKAGLVAEDIYNVKYVPKKVDDNLIEGKYVVVDKKAYRVPKNAPLEFVQEGIMIKKEFLELHDLKNLKDIEKIFPKNDKWKNLVITEEAELKDNGYPPTAITSLSLKAGKLTWNKHPHTDIIGYRIYKAANYTNTFTQVASIAASNELQLAINSKTIAAYYVTAVDVNGNESPPSKILTVGNWLENEPVNQTEPNKPEDPENSPPENGENEENSYDPLDLD